MTTIHLILTHEINELFEDLGKSQGDGNNQKEEEEDDYEDK
jgi:hypothetical protein